ncbi:MAG: hypothetical protein IPG50_04165 [Myxococcales bacterium]|nr:hypothetical protein [Myxococcales bacterium]
MRNQAWLPAAAPLVAALLLAGPARADEPCEGARPCRVDPAVAVRVLSAKAEAEGDARLVGGLVVGAMSVGALAVALQTDRSVADASATVAVTGALLTPALLFVRGPHERLLARYKERLGKGLSHQEATARTVDDWEEQADTARSWRIGGGIAAIAIGSILAGASALALGASKSSGPDHSTRGLGWIFLGTGAAVAGTGVVSLAVPSPLERSLEELHGGRSTPHEGATLTRHLPGLQVSGTF